MRRGPSPNLSKALRLLFCVMAFVGWLNVPQGAAAPAETPAVIQAITVADDGASAVIVADRPLTFTFYKVADPPKAVIDLAQTEPGAVAPVRQLSAGSVKGVAV